MKDIMKLGIEEARTTMNEGKGGPFGAVITDIEGKVIAIASNKVLESHDPTAHAEIMAIRKASEILGTHNLENCILYVTGYPCPMCLSAIMWANIKKVYYGTNLEDAEKIGFKDKKIYDYLKNNDNNFLDIEQLNYDECLELFEEYQENDKELY
ncbi:MAG: nucleoside deaminase [Bacilli bacterium]